MDLIWLKEPKLATMRLILKKESKQKQELKWQHQILTNF